MAKHVVVVDVADGHLSDQLQSVIDGMRMAMEEFDYDQTSHYGLWMQKSFFQQVTTMMDQGLEALYAAAGKRGLDIDNVVVDQDHNERAEMEGGPNVN